MEGFEFVDEVVSSGAPAAAQARPARRVVNESITVGSEGESRIDLPTAAKDDIISDAHGEGRVLSDRAKALLASFEAEESSSSAAAGAAGEDPPSSPSSDPLAGASAPPPAAAVASTPEAAPAAGPAVSTSDAVAARLIETNRKLVAELDGLRARPRGEPSAREKALDEAEQLYHGDSIGALRRFVAVSLGVADPADKAVSEEIAGLYQDLTAKELGVELDKAAKAERESQRTRRMLERDKRDRTAPPASTPSDPAVAMVPYIATQIAARPATEFPLTAKLATVVDGVEPAALIWREIGASIRSGEMPSSASDADLIAHASKKIETRYQTLLGEVAKQAPATSTATPTQAPAATASKTDPQPGVRTITNASASVAPATTPAAKPATTEKPKYRSEAERRLALARKHFDQT